jgi:Fe-S-cluster containining protein
MVPLLRPDVQTFVDPRGLIVYDPHTGLRVLLGPESTLLWDALSEGVGSASTLIHATPELSDAQRFVRLMQLDQALLLVSPRWRRQEHLFHARAKAVDSPLYVHPRLAHECVKCGSSCQEIHVGPISPLTVASLRSNDLWRSDPNAKSADDILFSAEVQKKSVLMLKQVDGHCAVWTHERGCTIHATSGHKLKPLACQQYPYTMTRTTRGVYVGLQMTCRSLPQSLKAGSSYRPTEIAQRLAPIVMSGGQTFTLPAPAPLSAGNYIPDTALDEWWKWATHVIEQALGELELKDFEYSVTETWRNVMTQLTTYVHEWLLRVDESSEASQWLAPDTWLFQSTLPTRYEVKMSFIDELQLAILEASMHHQREGRWQEMKRLERLYEAVEVWSDRWPLPKPRWRGDEADKLMSLTILEGVYSHRLFLQGDLIYGLAHLQLTLELTESLMRLSAHLSARRVIEIQEVNDALVLVNRGLREPVVDTALKRWAGGLRWLMSPDSMPYRHSLGTLEPHLFKLQTHLNRNRQNVDEAVREGASLAVSLIEKRSDTVSADHASESAQDQALNESNSTEDGEGSSSESEESAVLSNEKQEEAMIETISWVEGVSVQGNIDDLMLTAQEKSEDRESSNVTMHADPYPESQFSDDISMDKEEEPVDLEDHQSDDESDPVKSPRLKAAPRQSGLSSAPPKKGSKLSAPYDQAAGLRAAKVRKELQKNK